MESIVEEESIDYGHLVELIDRVMEYPFLQSKDVNELKQTVKNAKYLDTMSPQTEDLDSGLKETIDAYLQLGHYYMCKADENKFKKVMDLAAKS